MAQVIPSEGLKAMMGGFQAGDFPLTMHLYQNNYTPVAGSTAANFTECNFDGYAAQVDAYGAPFINGANQAEMDQLAPLTFTKAVGATPNQVYGYYITDPAGKVIGAELFAGGPFPMVLPGSTITVTDNFTFG